MSAMARMRRFKAANSITCSSPLFFTSRRKAANPLEEMYCVLAALTARHAGQDGTSLLQSLGAAR